MRVARRVAVMVIAFTLAGCGSSVTPSDAPAPTPTPTPTLVATTAGLLAPVRSGQTLTVLNGYDYPPPNETCPPKGYGHDHCGNQEFGLDLVPSDLSDFLVIAPMTGAVKWPASGLDAAGCLGITPDGDPTLNLTVCHLSVRRAGAHVVAGEVLGLRRPTDPWVHLSLNVQYAASGGQLAEAARTPVPFTRDYAIEGHDFDNMPNAPKNLHACETFVSTAKATGDTSLPDPLPVITQADLSVCLPPPTPTPTPTPTRTPTPTPNPATVLPPKPGHPTWTVLSRRDSADPKPDGSTIVTNRATWSEPDGAASKFLIYGLTTCPRESAKNNGKPCIVPGVALSMSDLDLLTQVNGSTRSAKVVWSRPRFAAGPDPYWAFLIRAVNKVGKSKFTILWSQDVCWECTY